MRQVPAGETWVGICVQPRPHIAIATRAAGSDATVIRFHPLEARKMGEQLIEFADAIAVDEEPPEATA